VFLVGWKRFEVSNEGNQLSQVPLPFYTEVRGVEAKAGERLWIRQRIKKPIIDELTTMLEDRLLVGCYRSTT